jgi:flagellar basal-body rod protein FlgB
MLIRDIGNFGARPALISALEFAGERHRLLVHNIANIDTPNFQPANLSVRGFRSALKKAVEERRQRASGSDVGPWSPPETEEMRRRADGSLDIDARTPSENVLYHDRNNRDLERMMQDLAENGLQYRFALDVLRQQGDLLRAAISQRV